MILWAYATMGRVPGERVLGLLEARVGQVAAACISQHVSNILWAYATMGREPGEQVLGLLEARALVVRSSMGVQYLMQLHQHILSCRLGDRPPRRSTLCELEDVLGARCHEAFAAAPTISSQSQQQVSMALRDMGLRVENEYRCPDSGYSIDMLVQGVSPSATNEGVPGAVQRWAVEFDGPSHFLTCGSPKGATLLKRRHLQQLGYLVVVVPYWEWDRVKGRMASEVQFLRDRIAAVGA